VAVFPPAAVLTALEALRERLTAELPGLRWTASRNLHFTLRFFGDLVPAERDSAARVLDAVVPGFGAFPLELAGVGVFGGWRNPRIFWAGAREGGDTLETLARTLDEAFHDARLGRADKPFRAHLTLGRWRDGGLLDPARARERCAAVGSVASFPVERVSLVTSRLSPGGSIYTPVHEVPLSPR
jgi:2'-5' RNA ligase